MNKKIFYVILGVTVLVMAFLLMSDTLNEKDTFVDDIEERQAISIPAELLGIPKIKEQTGPAAINSISQMHGTEITLSQGYILVYGNDKTSLTLWLSTSPTEEEAADLFQVMDLKMPASQVFLNRQPLTVEDRTIIKVDGMGQEHFYWQEGIINYWLAVEGEGSREEFIKEVINKVKQ